MKAVLCHILTKISHKAEAETASIVSQAADVIYF